MRIKLLITVLAALTMLLGVHLVLAIATGAVAVALSAGCCLIAHRVLETGWRVVPRGAVA